MVRRPLNILVGRFIPGSRTAVASLAGSSATNERPSTAAQGHWDKRYRASARDAVRYSPKAGQAIVDTPNGSYFKMAEIWLCAVFSASCTDWEPDKADCMAVHTAWEIFGYFTPKPSVRGCANRVWLM